MSNLDEYIEQHSSLEPDYLQQINRDTNLHVLNAHMLSGHVQGRLLSLLSQMIHPTRILELGTFTGYSALCLAEGLTDDGELVTIEHNDELADLIHRNLSLSPLGNKIHLLLGDAKEILGSNRVLNGGLTVVEPFDMVFIDADKREYCTYLDLIYPYVRVGGWILADNTLWDGHVIDPAYDKDAQTLGLRAFNDSLARDARFDKVILPIRDGLTIIRKK
ncbi:MAG: O-methyltransferase [Paludibacteraceae bacterium]|nr:O-methyltransferase [Paludibacteraceae bacterium]